MEELAKLEGERGNPAYAPAMDSRKGKERGRSGMRGKDPLTLDAGEGTNAGERVASNEMCTFLILNISFLQLIPVNMIAYRQQYGSVNPAGIIGPAIVATAVSTGVAIVNCKIKDRGRRV